MPLPPKPPELPRALLDVVVVEPALRLAVLDEALGAEAMLLPADEALTSLATEADLAVAALARADASAADLFVTATPPPVPDACPETEVLAASSAVLRDAA
jgi:hypothetical protein